MKQAAAAARLKRVPAGWQVAAPSADDAAVVEERQLGHPANMVGVPAVSLCRHGYPQAVLQDPGAHKFGAGMLRLTCPHLCEAIDAWEAEGAVRSLSDELMKEDSNRDALARVNARHAETRRSMVQGEALARAEARLGADTVRRQEATWAVSSYTRQVSVKVRYPPETSTDVRRTVVASMGGKLPVSSLERRLSFVSCRATAKLMLSILPENRL